MVGSVAQDMTLELHQPLQPIMSFMFNNTFNEWVSGALRSPNVWSYLYILDIPMVLVQHSLHDPNWLEM